MERYVRWYREGHLSCTGSCFDIGNTTVSALRRFEETGEPFAGSTDPRSAGNGSIMRLAPVPMFFFPDVDRTIHFAGESSRTTHGAAECVAACRLFAYLISKALGGRQKEDILLRRDNVMLLELPEKLETIACGFYSSKGEDEVLGSGYVVESLEAALWCFLKTDTFRDAILKAVNLGDDADTTAAVCGQIAGAYYGESGLPPEWLERLAMVDLIREMANKLNVTPAA